jgi:hypothetical protein
MSVPEVRTVAFSELKWLEGLSNNCVTKVTVTGVPVEDGSNNTVSVTLLALPGKHIWPCFMDAEKACAMAKSVIVLKGGADYPTLSELFPQAVGSVHVADLNDAVVVEDEDDFDPTDYSSGPWQSDDGRLHVCNTYPANDVPRTAAERLLMGRSVAFVGHPGVGKSVEMSVVLFYLLRQLAKVARGEAAHCKLRRVFLRIDSVLYRFSAVGTTIRCVEIYGVGGTLCELRDYMRTLWRGDRVADDTILLLEWNAQEEKPMMPYIPTLITLSSTRNEDCVLEPLITAGVLDSVIRPPHSPEALVTLAVASYLNDVNKFVPNIRSVGPDQSAGLSSSLPSTASVQDVTALVRSRIQTVGPVADVVLSCGWVYDSWAEGVNSSARAKEFVSCLLGRHAFDEPPNSEYFVAPYTFSSQKFLGPRCRDAVWKFVTNEHVTALFIVGLGWPLVEAVVLDHFVMKCDTAVPVFLNYREWEFYHNSPDAEQLYTIDRVSDAPSFVHQLATTERCISVNQAFQSTLIIWILRSCM